MNRRTVPIALGVALGELFSHRPAPAAAWRRSDSRCRHDRDCCGFNVCAHGHCSCIVNGSLGCFRNNDCCSQHCVKNDRVIGGTCRAE